MQAIALLICWPSLKTREIGGNEEKTLKHRVKLEEEGPRN